MSDIFKEIKKSLTCVQYAQQLGWQIRKPGDRTYSLEKGHNKSCLVVHNDYWHDYKTGKGGDVIDLSAQVNHGGDKSKALKELCYLLNISQNKEEYQAWVSYTQNLCNQIQAWHKSLTEEHYRYLAERNIKEETIKELRIGYNAGRIIVPYYKNNYVSYWIGRSVNGKQPKYLKPKLDGLNENTVWGLHTLQNKDKPLIITEGVFDAVSFQQEGYPVIASMGGYFSKVQLKTLISVCKSFQDIILCFDTDNAGIQFTLKLASILIGNNIKFYVAQPDTKDVNDYYIKNNHLNFLNNKTKGIKFLCNKVESQDEFKSIIKIKSI